MELIEAAGRRPQAHVEVSPERHTVPPEGAVLRVITVRAVLSGQGYLLRAEAEYALPGPPKRLPRGKLPQSWERWAYVQYASRPRLAAVLGDLADRVAVMSTSSAVSLMDGQDPLPGL